MASGTSSIRSQLDKIKMSDTFPIKTVDEMANEQAESILTVDELNVKYRTEQGDLNALRDVSLSLEPGETVGIAGESGSGKSTLAYAILQYLDSNGVQTGGTVTYKGVDLGSLSKRGIQRVRGPEIAHVPQDPNTSLNPSLTVGEQIRETIRRHQDLSRETAQQKTLDLLETVNIPDAEYNSKQYPHEFSGGMRQRVLFAIALSLDPDLLILDEPTTGLDVTTQSKVLKLIEDLKSEFDTTILIISHNISVLAQISDRMIIMYAGEVMERGPTTSIINKPANPYTQGLLAALPRIDQDRELKSIKGKLPDLHDIPEGCIFADRCEFSEPDCRDGDIEEEIVSTDSPKTHLSRCRRWEAALEEPIKPTIRQSDRTDQASKENDGSPIIEAESVKKHFGQQSFFERVLGGSSPVKAVDGVDLDVNNSETLGLVGESGCGKSTLGRLLLRLLSIDGGKIKYNNTDIKSLSGADMVEYRSNTSIVFQNPDSSLNPSKTIGSLIGRPMKMFTDLDKEKRTERIEDLLDRVELGPQFVSKYPHELSGGEKQRVAIARAFASNPAFIVLDEPVSSLDVSVQAQILELLTMLREEYDSSYLFISHDLSVIKHISDRIAVMYLGHIVEIGSNEAIFEPPYHPYTKVLLSNVLSPDPTTEGERVLLKGDVPSARNPPSGCPFQTRCPQKIGDICEDEHPGLEPTERSMGENHKIACHLDEADMMDRESNG